MKPVLATLLAAGALATSTSAASAPVPGPVTLDGVGRVVPGMTLQQVAAQWRLSARAVPSLCTYVPFRVGQSHGRALFLQGKLGAVFFDRGVRTAQGIGIGSTLAMLQRSYGRKLQSQNGSHFFFLTRRTRPQWQIRFDTNSANRVVQIAFGESAAVNIVTGCP